MIPRKILMMPPPSRDRELAKTLIRSTQVGQLAKFLVELQVSLPSEARYDATTLVIRKDDNRMKDIEWAFARKLVELHYGGQIQLRTLPLVKQSMWLYRAQEGLQFLSRCLEDIIHPDVIQGAMFERSAYETERLATQIEGGAQ